MELKKNSLNRILACRFIEKKIPKFVNLIMRSTSIQTTLFIALSFVILSLLNIAQRSLWWRGFLQVTQEQQQQQGGRQVAGKKSMYTTGHDFACSTKSVTKKRVHIHHQTGLVHIVYLLICNYYFKKIFSGSAI